MTPRWLAQEGTLTMSQEQCPPLGMESPLPSTCLTGWVGLAGLLWWTERAGWFKQSYTKIYENCLQVCSRIQHREDAMGSHNLGHHGAWLLAGGEEQGAAVNPSIGLV